MNPAMLQFLLPFLSGQANNIGTDIQGFLANQANLQRYGQGLSLIGSNIDTANQLGTNIQQTLGPQQTAAYNAYQGNLNSLMPMLEGAGTQERTDINRQFNNLGNQQAADLTSRGLSATTILPTLQQGTERSRADALGGLNERLLQQRLGLQQYIGQGQLQGQLGRMNDWANLASLPYQMSMPWEQSKLSFIQGRNDIGPNYANNATLNQNLGMGGPFRP